MKKEGGVKINLNGKLEVFVWRGKVVGEGMLCMEKERIERRTKVIGREGK